MKKVISHIAIIVLVTFYGAYNKEDHYEMKIVYYKYGAPKKYSEEINVDELIDNGNTTFIYHYKKLQKGNNNLLIKNNQVFFNNSMLLFLCKKQFMLDGKKFEVNKYRYDSGNSQCNIYINNNYGIIFFRNLDSNTINEYYPKEKMNDIHNQIIRDSLFFD